MKRKRPPKDEQESLLEKNAQLWNDLVNKKLTQLMAPIHELPNNFFAIPVPEDAINIDMATTDAIEYTTSSRAIKYIEIGPGNWTFIATSESISEEQAAGIVERAEAFALMESNIGSKLYFDYEKKNQAYKAALQSFESLLNSLNIRGRAAIIKKNP